MNVTFDQITDVNTPDSWRPEFDKEGADLSGEPQFVQDFYRDGMVIFPGLLKEEKIKAYCDRREAENIPLSGYGIGTPYMQVKELRDLCCDQDLNDRLSALFGGEKVAVNLNLTGWQSTERNLHQDAYLNPAGIGSHYLAVWMALDDISPDAGPFEYAVGSHRTPFITMERIFEFLTPKQSESPDWPWYSQSWVSKACEDEIKKQGFEYKRFIAKKGDVLVWHSRTLHRGTVPNVPGTIRKSLIAHYSVLSVRSKIDMPNYRQHEDQGFYFVF